MSGLRSLTLVGGHGVNVGPQVGRGWCSRRMRLHPRVGEVRPFIKLKTPCDLDPFTEPPERQFTADAREQRPSDKGVMHRASALPESTLHVQAVRARQFRTCVYSIFAAGSHGGFHSGDLHRLWRFSKTENEQRGHIWGMSKN